MRKEPEFEMRAEYDFSGAVRGRYAARMTAQERDELFRRAAIRDVQTWISFALLQVQALEAALFMYLVLAQDAPPKQAEATAAAILDAREPRGAGQLPAELCESGLSVDEFETRFRSLAKEREWLVHRSGFEGQAALPVSERTNLLLHRLRRISNEAESLRTELERLIEQHLARFGLSKREIDEKTHETAELWLAA